MGWMIVDIPGNEISNISAKELILAFVNAYRDAGLPPGVEVHHSVLSDGGHKYYFSPEASAVGADVLAEYRAVPFQGPPDPNLSQLMRL